MDYHALAVKIVDAFAWKVAVACFVLWLLSHRPTDAGERGRQTFQREP